MSKWEIAPFTTHDGRPVRWAGPEAYVQECHSWNGYHVEVGYCHTYAGQWRDGKRHGEGAIAYGDRTLGNANRQMASGWMPAENTAKAGVMRVIAEMIINVGRTINEMIINVVENGEVRPAYSIIGGQGHDLGKRTGLQGGVGAIKRSV